MADLPSAVLFACSMNAVRSPMAEAILKHLHGHHIYVDSVGTRKGVIHGLAVEAMDEIGIDLANHRGKTFDDLEDTSFDVVISLSPEAQHKAVEMTRASACELVFWNTLDPTVMEGNREMQLAAFRMVRDQILERIKERFPTGGPAGL